MKKFHSKTADYTYIGIFSALICACAWISVPSTPPFTMQIFAVALCGGLLGAKRAVLSVLIYMLLGAAGLPVFSGFRAGAATLFGATGGYILGFLPFAAVSGVLCRRAKRLWGRTLALFAGLVSCYAAGTLWYSVFFSGDGGIIGAVLYCVAPFVIPDLLKIFFAALCTEKLKKHLRIDISE